MNKRIVLCADDYGQAPSISNAILQLANMQRISAISCLVTSPDWNEQAKLIREFYGKIDIGLHFNLSEGKGLSAPFKNARFPSYRAWLFNAILKKINPNDIALECVAQLSAFKNALGFLPDFIDGHQHVHQFPEIRNAVIKVYRDYYLNKQAYIRVARERIVIQDAVNHIKRIVISQTGNGLKRLLDKDQIPYNSTFAGIYSFAKSSHYAQMFPSFLERLNSNGILMCHPGLGKDQSDLINEARSNEYRFLTSDAFLEICDTQKVRLGRFLADERG